MEDNERATEADLRIVFNRSDCPYGCGAELPPKLRWQATPCRRCRRTFYTVGSIVDDGRVLWPPASVPRPDEEGQPGVRVEYVVTDDDYDEARAIGELTRPSRHDGGASAWLFFIVVVVVLVVLAALVLWRLGRELILA